jgi:hypothetical protein
MDPVSHNLEKSQIKEASRLNKRTAHKNSSTTNTSNNKCNKCFINSNNSSQYHLLPPTKSTNSPEWNRNSTVAKN